MKESDMLFKEATDYVDKRGSAIQQNIGYFNLS